MADEPDVYSYLATSKVSEVTVTQLEQSLENSFINKRNIESWKGPITVHRLLEVSRTYPWGLPIPEASTITTTIVAAGETVTIQPPGTEIWDIKAIRGIGVGGDATTTMSYEDGVVALNLRVDDTVPVAGFLYRIDFAVSSPVRITNSLYMTVTETGLTNGVMVIVAYNVVSK